MTTSTDPHTLDPHSLPDSTAAIEREPARIGPRILVVPTARPTFVVEAARERALAARDLLEELGAEVLGPEDLVMTPEDIAGAREHLAADPDVVINVCASFCDANPALELYGDLEQPLVTWSFREPGEVGDRLWLNSLCGSNLYGHALGRLGRDVRLLYGDPDDEHVRSVLRDLLAGTYPAVPALPRRHGERAPEEDVREALAALAGSTIGVIGDPPPGFTPSQYDPRVLEDVLGLRAESATIEETFDRVDAVDARTTGEEVDRLHRERPTVRELAPEEVSRHAAVTSALRDWRTGAGLGAVAVRCWPEFPTQRGVCPCSSLSALADEGTPTVCERDVYGAATMLLLETLGAGATYLVDTVDVDAARNVVRLWHCGSAATTLAAEPQEATQSVHCNRKIGVAGNFALRTGPVIIARVTEDNAGEGGSGLRLLIGSGQSLPAENRFQGNTADVRLDVDANDVVHALVHEGFPHHTVLAWTDIRPRLRTAADLLDIPIVEW